MEKIKNLTLEEGQLVKYVGRGLKDFDAQFPYARVLESAQDNVWIDYKGRRQLVNLNDLEVVND